MFTQHCKAFIDKDGIRFWKELRSTCMFLLSVLQGLRLLGILDVQNTPCAREAILHGAGGSVAAGLLYFLATSES